MGTNTFALRHRGGGRTKRISGNVASSHLAKYSVIHNKHKFKKGLYWWHNFSLNFLFISLIHLFIAAGAEGEGSKVTSAVAPSSHTETHSGKAGTRAGPDWISRYTSACPSRPVTQNPGYQTASDWNQAAGTVRLSLIMGNKQFPRIS